MTTAVSAVFFDAGNTLLRAHPGIAEVYVEVAGAHAIHREVDDIRGRFRDVWRRKASVPRPEKAPLTSAQVKAWWKRFVAEIFSLEVGCFDPFFDDLYDRFADPSTWRVFDDVLPCLTALRSRSIRLGVLSNWDERLPSILESHGLSPHFETLIISAVEGCEKPDPAIYRVALGRLGVPPDRAAHVGDSPVDDARGATDAGLRGVLVDREDAFPDFDGERVTTLSDLPALLA